MKKIDCSIRPIASFGFTALCWKYIFLLISRALHNGAVHGDDSLVSDPVVATLEHYFWFEVVESKFFADDVQKTIFLSLYSCFWDGCGTFQVTETFVFRYPQWLWEVYLSVYCQLYCLSTKHTHLKLYMTTVQEGEWSKGTFDIIKKI